MKKVKVKPELSASESVIMKAIWDKGGEDIAVQELLESLRMNYGKDYKRTSIGTFLDKIEKKGFVKTYRVGRCAYVSPLKTEQEYKVNLLQDETDFWFRGQVSDVVAALSRKNGISKEEIERIRRFLDEEDD